MREATPLRKNVKIESWTCHLCLTSDNKSDKRCEFKIKGTDTTCGHTRCDFCSGKETISGQEMLDKVLGCTPS
ncbi:uncharacterized protein LY89DRAFT_691542 [Mollisia scopiformis]|uniref:Uncharacterized protein n=1 Tax=Mollisia scopiformis TaxID=149040 RepID=A0A132B6A0_MOLSC|nr:uncharacterized protein LY89DRAFT_691542 [Mollisia scopiformis]KUJ07861.1 hypothetical protein LY89DRAFT_691542 [Mollisia scopiformis]